MASKKQIAEISVQNAFAELRLGKKQAARSWALRAVALAPELEDPWLILAALAGPRAGLEYLKEALKINPGSQRARRGLFEVQQQLEKISKVAVTQGRHQNIIEAQRRLEKTSQGNLPQPLRREPDKGKRPRLLACLGLFSTFALAIVVIATLFLFASQSGIVKAHGWSSSVQQLISLQLFSTPTPTVTETPQPTDTPSATPLPSETPTPTLTDTPSPTETSTPTDTPSPTETPSPTDTPSPTPSPEPTLTDTAVVIKSALAAAPANASGDKRIIVYISQQHLYAYSGNTLVYSFVVSTGAYNATRIGTFSILDKIPRAWSDPWGFWMPDWLGIYWVGYIENGIHALPVLSNGNVIWGDGLGTPISHGCVVLSTEDARLLYNWAETGTRVEILR